MKQTRRGDPGLGGRREQPWAGEQAGWRAPLVLSGLFSKCGRLLSSFYLEEQRGVISQDNFEKEK